MILLNIHEKLQTQQIAVCGVCVCVCVCLNVCVVTVSKKLLLCSM